MVKIYVRMIKAGKMTLDAVPSLWYDKVVAALEAQ